MCMHTLSSAVNVYLCKITSFNLSNRHTLIPPGSSRSLTLNWLILSVLRSIPTQINWNWKFLLRSLSCRRNVLKVLKHVSFSVEISIRVKLENWKEKTFLNFRRHIFIVFLSNIDYVDGEKLSGGLGVGSVLVRKKEPTDDRKSSFAFGLTNVSWMSMFVFFFSLSL